MLVTDLPQDRNARFVAIRRPLIQLANRCRHTAKMRPMLRAQLKAILAELDAQDEVDTLAAGIDTEEEQVAAETGSALTQVNVDEIINNPDTDDPIAKLLDAA